MFRLEHPETVMVSVFGNQKTVTVWLSHMDHKFSEHTVTVSEGKSVDAFQPSKPNGISHTYQLDRSIYV